MILLSPAPLPVCMPHTYSGDEQGGYVAFAFDLVPFFKNILSTLMHKEVCPVFTAVQLQPLNTFSKVLLPMDVVSGQNRKFNQWEDACTEFASRQRTWQRANNPY